MSPLLLGEILGVSVKSLATDGNYFLQHCDNLLLAIQMQLSEK